MVLIHPPHFTSDFVERAVRELAHVSQPGAGYAPIDFPVVMGRYRGIYAPFVAIPFEDEFHGRTTLRYNPPLAAEVRQLVDLGFRALPSLLRHIDDSTPTKLSVKLPRGGFFGDGYDPRRRSPFGIRVWFIPSGDVYLGDHFGQQPIPAAAYTLALGDLCYFILGQIVNRRLFPVEDSPSAPYVINSPVHNPDLAARARADWTGLTKKEHVESLELDVDHGSMPRPDLDAFNRLRFYYPDCAATHAGEWLRRPVEHLFGPGWLSMFLIGNFSPKFNDSAVKHYAETHSQASMQLAALMASGWLFTPRFEKQKARAKEVLKQYFPAFDPLHPPETATVEVQDMAMLLQATRGVASAELDAAAETGFEHARDAPVEGYSDLDWVDDVAMECVHRLGLREPFLSYLKWRAAQIEPAAGWVTVPTRRLEMVRLLARPSSQMPKHGMTATPTPPTTRSSRLKPR